MSFSASAPASLMLLGEYAVLHGQSALVCAVNQRMTVTLTPRADKQIEIVSPALGHLITTIADLQIVAPFQFVLATLKRYQKKLPTGCTITIDSGFSHQVGLGSSAAVTVATLRALIAWLAIPHSAMALIREARAIVRAVQGVGSGADVAACVLGGIVHYKMQPLTAEKLPHLFPLTVIYSGYKTPTVAAIQQVQHTFAAHPAIYKQLMKAIGVGVTDGLACIRAEQWSALGRIMTVQQGLMEALNVSTPLLADIVNQLRQCAGIVGAKISGSGLGDCIVGLGLVSSESMPLFSDQRIQCLPIEMSAQGVTCEKN